MVWGGKIGVNGFVRIDVCLCKMMWFVVMLMRVINCSDDEKRVVLSGFFYVGGNVYLCCV